MSTPSAMYPYSPTPDNSTERRRSKRESTASQTRRLDEAEAALTYPSPPSTASEAGRAKRRSQTYDPSLVIPPYNASSRRSSTTPSATTSVTHTHAAGSPALSVSMGNPRPVSAAVIPVPHSTAVGPNASRSRQSVSYLPTNTSNAAAQQQVNMAFPYTPHPLPKQRVMFGPYILLQTLGEGEFGKVKLGLHAQRWGEEVAIKLIKRGNVDTIQRTAKVRREIDVLKAVRHPNIVRLYDVIETEKYIGIVLEYASGGELFDHILAHRYLKDRDASKLFAQLISAVMYLHAKGVVHRDLKLENLLLDRNRNVIVTDFGFANRFFDARRDLMSTSCGSPCYAAPELVIQDGKYVGTAVDVWSCGVILYAMLAGYLPYDDDPANPEGDNINLLYKYITTTELTFPDWITQEARELLLMMLVSDPEKRCTVHDVARRSWLRKYYGMLSLSVDQLEYEAQQAEIAKRQALEAQRQYLLQQQALASGAPPPMTRSQSSSIAAANRHRSAIVTSPTMQHGLASMAEEAPAPLASRAPVVQPYQPSSARRQTYNTAPSPTTQAHPVTVDADAFSFDRALPAQPVAPPMSVSLSAPPVAQTVVEDQVMSEATASGSPIEDSRMPRSRPSSQSTTPSTQSRRSSARDLLLEQHLTDSERRKKANRATLPGEFTPSRPARLSDSPVPAPAAVTESEDVDMEVASSIDSKPSTDAMSTDSRPVAPAAVHTDDASISQAMEGLPAPLPVEKDRPATSSDRPSTPPVDAVPVSDPSTPIAVGSTKAGSSSSSATPKKRKNGSPSSSGAKSASNKSDLPPLPTAALAKEATPRAAKKTTNGSSSDSASLQAPSVASSGSRHRTALSTDRFSLKSLLGSSTASVDRTASKPSSVATGDESSDRDSQMLEEMTNQRRKTRRQKALSLQPFKTSTSGGRTDTFYRPELEPISAGSVSGSGSNNPRNRQSLAAQPPHSASAATPSKWSGMTRSSTSQRLSESTSSTTIPSNASVASGSTTGGGNKAKAVMDWIRRRSTRNAFQSGTSLPAGADGNRHQQPQGLSARQGRQGASSVSSRASQTPSVFVTESEGGTGGVEPEMTSIPSSRSASGAHSSVSHFSQISTAATTATTVSTAAPLTPTKASMSPAAPPAVSTAAKQSNMATTSTRPTVTPVPSVFAENKLRIHQGATNKNMVTTRSPPLVIVELKNALWSMGIDFVAEGEYRLKCTRKSRKKAASVSLNQSVSGVAGGNRNNASYGVSGGSTSLTASPSMTSGLAASPSMSFRTFFSRRNSLLAPNSPASALSPDSPAQSPQVGSSKEAGSGGFSSLPQPMPTYGDASTDLADEVKFNVELTRVRDLQGVYCVDVRRLKGELKSFKFVYQNLLANVKLSTEAAGAVAA